MTRQELEHIIRAAADVTDSLVGSIRACSDS